jgi:heme/copper-type cytochrome/quinol oxidase subunit 2
MFGAGSGMILVYIAAAFVVVILLAVVCSAMRRRREGDLPSDEEIAHAARDGRWTQALRSYRVLHGVGLKRATIEVQSLMEQAQRRPTNHQG